MRSLAVAMALLTAVDGATLCPNADNQPAPNVTTLLVSPSNDSVAWVLSPDCSLTTHFVTPDGDGTGELHCNGTDIKSIASLPSGAERLYLDNSYSLRSADFSSYNSVIHIILSYSGLTDVGTFKFPESLEELDFEGNTLSGIAPGVIPDKVRYLYLGDNALSSLSNFSLPQSLETLTLNDNQFTSINFELPSGLREIEFSRNTVAAIENLTIPKTLTSFLCNECATRYFRGVELSPALEKLELDGSRLLQFEVRQSDLAIIQAMNLSIASTTTSCDDELATLQTVGQLAVCVIPDDYFEVKYPARLGAAVSSSSPAPDNGTTDGSSSSSILAIVLGVVGGTLVLGIVAFMIHRTFRRRTTQSGDTDPDQKYRNAGMDPTLELPGSSSKATAASSSHRGSQEYLSNDVRNDEALIPFRIAYDEIQVVREIAKGGYGVIQLGRWRGRDVAIKQLLPEKCREMTVIKSFMDEIRLCSKLEHPKVVEFIGVSWSTLIDVAVISEFMAGGDLSLTLRSQQYLPKSEDWFAPSSSLPPKTLVALDVIEALVYLHSFNSPIIHRDLKARNVLLDCDGNAKLSDFGISREVSLDETMTGEVGTVAWIAPEVLQGERYSEKADIYSLGVLLSELDTCRHPYSHDPRDGPTPQTNTRIALLVSTGKLLPRLTLDCPASIHSLILSCLQYDASDRPSALEVHYELRKIHQQYTMGL